MDAKEEFEQYKIEYEKKMVKRARKTATVFGVLAITALIALVFAFFQNAESQRTRVMAEMSASECKQNEKKLREEIGRLEENVSQMTNTVNAALKEAERQFQAAQKKNSK